MDKVVEIFAALYISIGWLLVGVVLGVVTIQAWRWLVWFSTGKRG